MEKKWLFKAYVVTLDIRRSKQKKDKCFYFMLHQQLNRAVHEKVDKKIIQNTCLINKKGKLNNLQKITCLIQIEYVQRRFNLN